MLTWHQTVRVQALEAAANQVKAALEKDNEALRGMWWVTDHMLHSADPLTTPILIAKVADLQKAGPSQLVAPVVPKPKGSSYNLQKKMGLNDDPVKYDEIKVCPRSPFLPWPIFTADPDSLEEVDEECGIQRWCDIHQPAQGKDCQVCKEGSCGSIV